MAQICTKIGTFDVEEVKGKVVLFKNGTPLAVLKDVYPWDKDGIIDAIEGNGKRITELVHNIKSAKATTDVEIP
jgi:uncharacterized protein YrrD